jgi:hypothetical protein
MRGERAIVGRITFLVASASLALTGPALAAAPSGPPPTAPRPYEPPKAQVESDPTCLAETVESSRPNASILLRNTCAIRVNFALCIRRSDEAKGQISHGSLAPAAVYGQDVAFTPKTQHFTHRATFCSGLICEVADPDC